MTAGMSRAALRQAALRDFERQYASASSAAGLILDSMSEPECMNVLTIICLQCANGNDEVMTMQIKADGLPPAFCRVWFDRDLNLYATVETDSLTLALTLPATQSGVIGWEKKNAQIKRIERNEQGEP